jgi:hypothetical protein
MAADMEAGVSTAAAPLTPATAPPVGERQPTADDARPEAPVRLRLRRRADLLGVAFAVLFGVVLTLCVEGYQFGKSNHTVYLLDALRKTDPQLLANDWFTTQTLQYHAVFGFITSSLYKLGVIEPSFLVGYLMLAVLYHLGWYVLTVRVGGGQMTYLLSLLLFYLSAGGFGLGMYQFLQDGSFLPSNIANVALLWALVMWAHGSIGWAGLAMGVAGLFHLNHAVVGIGLWSVMSLWELWRPTGSPMNRPTRGWWIGTALAFIPSLINIALAMQAKLTRSGAMPLSQFVDLYVHLRHPHHYDPSSWPLALWICFLWPIPFAIVAARLKTPPISASAGNGEIAHPTAQQTRFARIQLSRFFVLFCGLLAVALLGAGIWYVSESLVQMSLYRFSIYPKLLSCIGVAYLVCNTGRVPRAVARAIAVGIPVLVVMGLALLRILGLAQDVIWRQPGPIGLFVALCCGLALYELSRSHSSRKPILHPIAIAALLAVLGLGWGRWMGFDFGYTPDPSSQHAKVCDYVAGHTPVDATFLVSPSDETFRLRARRAIVVNFKAVPQLSGELATWQKRMCDVLDIQSLSTLPRPFYATIGAMDRRYDELSAAQLEKIADLYGARYVLTRHRVEDPHWESKVEFGSGDYVLYDRLRK